MEANGVAVQAEDGETECTHPNATETECPDCGIIWCIKDDAGTKYASLGDAFDNAPDGSTLKMCIRDRFYAAMFGSAVGCAYVTLTNVQNISPGAAGIIGFVCIKSGGMLNYMIGILISLVVGFVVTMALSKHPKFKEV